MTAYAADPSLTMSAARDLYFAANDFGPNGGYDDAWVDFKLGPIPLPFPNTRARIRAVRVHDLHHVLTGYATDALGEFEISAWELGGGCEDFWAAWHLNLMGMAAGALAIPRRTWRAFVRGRHSENLYATDYDAALLARRVGELREELELGETHTRPRATLADAAVFAGYLAAGAVLGAVTAPLLLPVAVLANVAALFRARH
jgi:hypothetical protein